MNKKHSEMCDMERRLLIVLSILILILPSCKETITATDEDNIMSSRIISDKILDEFLTNSEKFGFSFEKENVEIVLTDNVAVQDEEYCGYALRNVGTIALDTTSLCWTTGFSNQESILYHELGHYFLLHGHTEHVLQSELAGSIMHPAPINLYQDNDTSLQKYYKAQLFDASTIPPLPPVLVNEWIVDEFKNGDFENGIKDWRVINTDSAYKYEVLEKVSFNRKNVLRIKSIPSQITNTESITIDQIFKIERDIPVGSVLELVFDVWVRELNYSEEERYNVALVRLSSQDYDPNPSFLLRKDFNSNTNEFETYRLIVPNYKPVNDSISIRIALVNGVEGEVYFDNFNFFVKEG